MIKKDYYKLTELAPKTAIDNNDYDYIVKKFKETLYIDLYAQPVLLVNELLSERDNQEELAVFSLDELNELAKSIDSSVIEYEGVCLGEYTGVARLIRQSKNNVLRRNTDSVELLMLDDIKGLKSVSDNYTLSTPLPNDVIKSWSGNTDNKTNGVKAYLIESLVGELVLESKLVTPDMLIVPEYQVEHIKALITPCDIDKPQENTIMQSMGRSSDFSHLVNIIISSQPHISAKEFWTILEKEIQTDEGQREYDKYNILTQQIGNEIFWRSRYGNSGSQKFNSINTTLSRAKKKLKTV